jgi:hypothetical protein
VGPPGLHSTIAEYHEYLEIKLLLVDVETKHCGGIKLSSEAVEPSNESTH